MFNPFKKSRRDPSAIFRFWDGERERGIDPIKVMRELRADKRFDPELHLPQLESADDAEAAEASQLALDAVRRIFGVEPWAEFKGKQFGLTEAETLGILDSFGQFLLALKKNGNGPVTSPPATGPKLWEPSSTNAGSGCGSTSIERKQDGPLAS